MLIHMQQLWCAILYLFSLGEKWCCIVSTSKNCCGLCASYSFSQINMKFILYSMANHEDIFNVPNHRYSLWPTANPRHVSVHKSNLLKTIVTNTGITDSTIVVMCIFSPSKYILKAKNINYVFLERNSIQI